MLAEVISMHAQTMSAEIQHLALAVATPAPVTGGGPRRASWTLRAGADAGACFLPA